MEWTSVISALAGTVLGFLLSLIPRALDSRRRNREARAYAVNLATEWVFRVASAPDQTWARTLEGWSEMSGVTIARFSAAKSKGNQYPLGWFTLRMTELIDMRALAARDAGGSEAKGDRARRSQEWMTLAVTVRDALAAWVVSDSHVHWFAEELRREG